MKKIILISFVLLPTIAFSQILNYPNELSNSLWLGLSGGASYYLGDFETSNIEFYGRGEFEYLFLSTTKGIFGLKLFGGYGLISGKNSEVLSIGLPLRNSNKFFTYLSDAGAGLTYLINYKTVKPYLTLGGYSTFLYKVLDQSKNKVYDKTPDVTLGFFSEAGFKIKLTEGLTLNLLGIFKYPNNSELDGFVSNKKDLVLNLLTGFSVYFLGLKDSDMDKVPDKYDLCPNTPPGIIVDEFGCPVQKRRLNDSDSDGVDDNLDKCPQTPVGVVVDKNGCPIDSDGDSIPDYLDRCPGTPLNFPVDEKGCPLDSDNDGVLDFFDKCPETPVGILVNDEGCSIDLDNDGVPDSLDKCPNTPSKTKVNIEGCPEEENTALSEKQLFVLQGMTTFESGTAKLTDNARKELRMLSEIIKKYPGSLWRIEGHTDSHGSAEFNKKLSQERADAVKKFLIGLGVSEKALIAVGMGENYPVADNHTEEGRKKNRRVVITKVK